MSESANLFRSGYIVDRRQDYVWFLGLPIVALVFAFVSGQYAAGRGASSHCALGDRAAPLCDLAARLRVAGRICPF